MIHDRVTISAARLLFRIGHRDGYRVRDSQQRRHMLYWLGVLIETEAPRF